MSRERILVVDDEPGVRSALGAILRDEGFDVVTAASGEEGLEAMGRGAFDAVLLDVWLPGIDGLETLTQLRDRRVDAEIVMISGHGTIETAVRATKLGAFDFVEKPLSLEKTILVLRNALRQRHLEQRNRRLMAQLSRDIEILGRSLAAERLRDDLAGASGSDAPVLLCGERGTGRESVARGIHIMSRRSGEAFVSVPCAALGASAAAQVLFGGPNDPGRIHLAMGGSLFLEEVDRLDSALQERLAAFLGQRGSDAPDVRLLASVGLEGGSLSPWLSQHLAVVKIVVPPLRERREDIPLLAERMMADLAREYGKRGKGLSSGCLVALTAHSWPGNLRELRNLIEGLLLTVAGETIEEVDLPEELGGSQGPVADLYGDFESLAHGIQAFELYYLRRILREEGGNLLTAARRLGLDPASLEARAKTLRL